VATNDQEQAAINDIRAFCYAIQLCYFLATGMVKSSKQCLRQLHITVQAAEAAAKMAPEGEQPQAGTSSAPSIRWLTPELVSSLKCVSNPLPPPHQLTGFAYVLTVLCNIQYSNFERAHRYLGISQKHLEGMQILMRQRTWPVLEHRTELFIQRMEALLQEGAAQMYLVMGNTSGSLDSVILN
jgi:hypothetical protein